MSARRIAALMVVATVLVACSAGTGAGGRIEGNDWVLRSYLNGGSLQIVPETMYADATFESSRVHGFACCNDYDAIARANGRSLFVSQAAVTQKTCGDETDAFETTYLALLDQSRFFGVRADTLTILGPSGETLLVFDAAPENPLLGKWVVDSFESAPGTQVAVLPGTEITAVFGLTSVGGSAGCNTFDGTYGTNGNVVRIGRLATTRQACADDVMTQESQFLQAFEGFATIERRAGSINLRDVNGDIRVAMSRPAEPEASPSPSASPSASAAEATATPKPTATPTAKPTPAPTPTPTAAPSATPTATPTAAPTAAPTVEPPPSLPPVASCTITGAGGLTLAKIVYPGSWHTLTTPPNLACLYFDPQPITVPADAATLQTAVTISGTTQIYADAVAAATDPSQWTAVSTKTVTVSGLQATLVQGTSTDSSSGTTAGATRYAYLIDYGPSGTLILGTTGTVGTPEFTTDALVVDLMASQSIFTPVVASPTS